MWGSTAWVQRTAPQRSMFITSKKRFADVSEASGIQVANPATGDPMGKTDTTLMAVPLYSGTRLIGFIEVENFLPQKSGFVDTDFGLFELISGHSGIGIETAWIRANAEQKPLERQAIEHLVGG